MEKMYYPGWNETVYFDRLPNGLPIYVVPRPGFTKKLCYFVTDFGSIHREFTLEGEPCKMSAGIAHYLEHKLFESEELDAFARYAKTGASANAYTSFDQTVYYFETADKFEESVAMLVKLIKEPYFTAENVEKERGIQGMK